MTTPPENAIAAVTHPDPYPYYEALVAEKPLYYDEALHLWIAASAEAVRAVLCSEACRVRPVAEPIPRNLVGSSAERIFGALVRMTDGDGHCPLKKAVVNTLDRLDLSNVFETSLRHAQALAAEDLTDFAFKLPAYTVADLLGVPQQQLASVAMWMGDFVRCLSPISTPDQIEEGKQAAEQLFSLFAGLLRQERPEKNPTLLEHLSQILSQLGINDLSLTLANAIGFISQTYEATAGLIGNALLMLAKRPDLYINIGADLTLLDGFVAEVARFDAPVQNTRRFLTADAIIGGQAMKAGDAILVLLAAANRDPAANAQPDAFDIRRENPSCFTFGSGVHACPGQALAQTIAHAALHHLITSGLDVGALPKEVAYRPSGNTRVPLFT